VKFDLCLPVYRNIRCLRASVDGLLARLDDRDSVERVLLHVQDPEEESEIINTLSCFGRLNTLVVSRGPGLDMAGILNKLCCAAKAPWVVFSEQDVFLHCSLDVLVSELDDQGFDIAGPVDTMHYTNPQARSQPHYGQYSRLSPEPGYFHSSLIILKKSVVAGHDAPFSLPEGFRLHGYGVLGGESYYGLRVKFGEDRSRLAFFTQRHADYGYAAAIEWGDLFVATHLYYSSTKAGYVTDGFLSPGEFDWLVAEEEKFLRDYAKEPV
jgi:hypothetical protein